MRWAEKYIGLKFVDKGRSIEGLDCWGLVRLVMKEEKGIELETYGDISATALMMVTRKIMNDSDADPWIKVTTPQAFDVVVMRGNPLHVGIMLSDKLLLHIEEATASVLVPINSHSVQQRIMKIRRHRELACNMA
jgi:cell wall-associated NlpC family hydrolase